MAQYHTHMTGKNKAVDFKIGVSCKGFQNRRSPLVERHCRKVADVPFMRIDHQSGSCRCCSFKTNCKKYYFSVGVFSCNINTLMSRGYDPNVTAPCFHGCK